MKKILVSTVIFVLLIAASVFAFTKSNAANFCPMKQTAQVANADYSKVVVARGDDDCCQKDADCCKKDSCCKHKRK